MTTIEAANGVHRIVCEHMASAAKIHAVENGRDVRRYTLLAFGGAGPIHAREVARRTGCREDPGAGQRRRVLGLSACWSRR